VPGLRVLGNSGMKVAHWHFLNEFGASGAVVRASGLESATKPEQINSLTIAGQCKTLENLRWAGIDAREDNAIAGRLNASLESAPPPKGA
jgi:hypothetical protein